MFSINETVLCGNYSVCEIADIKEMCFGEESCMYYVLKPVFDNNQTLYMPVASEKAKEMMFKTLSCEEMHLLIKKIPNEETIWIEDENERKEKYKEILQKDERRDFVKLTKTLYRHRENLKKKGRKLYVADEKFFKDAEKLLFDEIAHVLKIDRKDVLSYLSEQIEQGDSSSERVV